VKYWESESLVLWAEKSNNEALELATKDESDVNYHAEREIHRRDVFIFGTYAGKCSNCASSIVATLTRWDTDTKCPVCLRYSNLDSFTKHDMKI
jgi:hypothetical protein